MEINKVYHGKMEEVLMDFPDNYCHSIVTDPPYGLSFMNKHWDYDVPTVEQWKEAFRVLKPGGFLLAFGGTRTYHRMVVNIEDAGFEIRDQIQWLYASGFPKSLNVALAIDKKYGHIGDRGKAFVTAGAGERKDIQGTSGAEAGTMNYNNPISDEAKQWNGYGTALKPANEPICVARKPVEGTVAENVLKYGCGGLNIDGCRIGTEEIKTQGGEKFKGNGIYGKYNNCEESFHSGRFPANVILDEFMGAELDKQSGISSQSDNRHISENDTASTKFGQIKSNSVKQWYPGEGGASRFFYCPKPDNFERNKGCEKLPLVQVAYGNQQTAELKKGGKLTPNAGVGQSGVIKPTRNPHPTVKPIDLMRYLVRLVTPKYGICLDPFCGSGTTLIAAKMELMNYVGIDMDESHIPLAEARIKNWNPDLYKAQELF